MHCSAHQDTMCCTWFLYSFLVGEGLTSKKITTYTVQLVFAACKNVIKLYLRASYVGCGFFFFRCCCEPDELSEPSFKESEILKLTDVVTLHNTLVMYHHYHNLLFSFFEICFQSVASVHAHNTRLLNQLITLILWKQPMVNSTFPMESPWRNNACTRVPTVFLRFRKRKIQFTIFNKTKIENQTSNFNFHLQEKRKFKFDFHRKCKLKFGCQFSYFKFSIRTRNIHFRFEVLTSGESEKAWNEQRSEGNENQSLWK